LENPLNYKIKTITIIVNSIAPTYLNYNPNILTYNYGDNGISASPLVSNTGGIVKFKIISGDNPLIKIDSLNGKIYTLGILGIGSYPLQIEVSNNIGAISNTYTIEVLNQTDSIIGYTNSVIKFNSLEEGSNGDYINLPTLPLDSNFTVETWFNLNANTGTTFPFIYNFGGWQNTNSHGLILAGAGSRTLDIKSWGEEANGNAPNDISGYVLTPNIWYHLAVVVHGRNSKLYVNGQIIKEYTSLGNPTNNNLFTNNRIGNGQDVGNVSTTVGKFRNFKIWKKSLSPTEITETFLVNTGATRQSLFYYLPLSNYANSSSNFNSYTNIENYAKNDIALDSLSYIISKNNVGAQNYVDTNEQVIFGPLYDSIKLNEFIQVSIDTGLTWNNALVYRNNWQYRFVNKPTTNQILVRGYDSTNNLISRIFTPFGSKIKTNKIINFNYATAKKVLNYKDGWQSTIPNFYSDTLVQFRIFQNPLPNFISINSTTGVISIHPNTHILNDSFLIQAYNLYDTVGFYYKIQILPIKPVGLSYNQDSINLYVGSTKSIYASLTEVGGENLEYSIQNTVNGVNINASTGQIDFLADLETGVYDLIVLATNRVGYDSTVIHVEVKQYTDTILNFLGNTIQLTTNGVAANGDYIRLPTINLDSSFTIETWFNLNQQTGTSYPFIYNLGGWLNANSHGLILAGAGSRTLDIKSWGIEANGNAPNNLTGYVLTPNIWYHLAVVVHGRNTKLYVNGQIVKEYTSLGNPTNNNTFTNNLIGNGQAGGNVSTPLGKFK
ncbi:MAG: LamG domain-containing protein, partial [Sediminibacterium sp.]|nr:LamG domain-containing protein [Sediminibacterium sp.]